MMSAGDHADLKAQQEHVAQLKSMDAGELHDYVAQAKARDAERKKQEEELDAVRLEALKLVELATQAGRDAFRRGDYEEAELLFTEALESGNIDNRHEIVCNRAACALKLRRFADAVADAGEATALEPAYLKGHWRLAQAQQALGKLDRAAAACRCGLELDPENAQLSQLLAELQAEAAAGNRTKEEMAPTAAPLETISVDPAAQARAAALRRSVNRQEIAALTAGNELLDQTDTICRS